MYIYIYIYINYIYIYIGYPSCIMLYPYPNDISILIRKYHPKSLPQHFFASMAARLLQISQKLLDFRLQLVKGCVTALDQEKKATKKGIEVLTG